jgi:hypothetical protein
MSVVVRIAGQGLAGTLLARALERAGVAFELYDPGHEAAASRVGAGLVSPVTGERWTLAPGWAQRAAGAKAFYRGIEAAWGVSLVTELRVWRVWRHEAEERLVRAKVERGDLAPWVTTAGLEANGAWIEGAWRVDLPAVLAAGRARWKDRGCLREVALVSDAEKAAAGRAFKNGPVIWCTGAAETRVPGLRPVAGETLELAVGGAARDLPPEVVRHDGVWVLPVGSGRAWAGASFIRDETERLARREELQASARRLLADREWHEVAVLSGWRMTTAQRMPVSGWLPGSEGREGVLNGLGSKGVLWGPELVEQWMPRLRTTARPDS